MKISELIAELEKLKAEHGDVPVCSCDSYGDQAEVQEIEVKEYGGSKVIRLWP